MDNQTSIQQIKNKIKQFCDERDWDQYHSPKELAIGVITEASELLEHFRFKTEKQMEEMLQNEQKKTQIAEELADTFYFILRMAQKYNIDITTEFNKKMQKNALKYPVEKAKGQNKKYDEF